MGNNMFYLTAVAKLTPTENEVIYLELIPQILRKWFTSINNKTININGVIISSRQIVVIPHCFFIQFRVFCACNISHDIAL